MANLLSRARPDLEIVFLVQRYTAPLLVHHDPPYPAWIVEDKPPLSPVQAIVHVYPRFSLAQWAFRAGIPQRIGTSRRWYHWLFCNERPPVSRRYSFLHESLLSLRLILSLLPAPWREQVLSMTQEDLLSYRARLVPQQALPEPISETLRRAPLRIGLHVGGKGGAPAWPTSSWGALVEILRRRYPEALFAFTGSAEEKPRIDPVAANLPPDRVLRTEGLLSLPELISFLSRVDVLISGSTGPLHIAAALDVPVVGVFPATAAMGPWRWAPLSPHATVFAKQEVCAHCTYPPRTCLCLAEIEALRLAEAAAAAFQRKGAELR